MIYLKINHMLWIRNSPRDIHSSYVLADSVYMIRVASWKRSLDTTRFIEITTYTLICVWGNFYKTAKNIIMNNHKPLHYIWFKIFFVINTSYPISRAEELLPDFDRIRVLLNSSGGLHWEPGGIFRTTCDIDISYFPFDTQVWKNSVKTFSRVVITPSSNILLSMLILYFLICSFFFLFMSNQTWN